MRTRLRLALAGALAFAACGGGQDGGLPRGRVVIQGQTLAVEVARTSATREQGLSGRASLEPGTGMLFIHSEPEILGYWMKDMNFAIDILWLHAGRIVDISHRVPPPATPDADLPTYGPRVAADAVLELPAGYARAHGFDRGQRVTIELDEP